MTVMVIEKVIVIVILAKVHTVRGREPNQVVVV